MIMKVGHTLLGPFIVKWGQIRNVEGLNLWKIKSYLKGSNFPLEVVVNVVDPRWEMDRDRMDDANESPSLENVWGWPSEKWNPK